MKLRNLLYGFSALAIVALTGCAGDEPVMPDVTEENADDTTYEEADKCDGTVSVKLLDTPAGRASSAFNPLLNTLTATRCDMEDDNFTLVSYHGRNKEQVGMVQVINHNTNEVVSEIYFDDARVNYCAFYNKKGKQVAYVGVDKTTGDKCICGIVAVPMKNGKFNLGEGVTAADLTPYYVDGVSVNCIKFVEQASTRYLNSALIVASGGNNQLADNARSAGFTKFHINLTDPTILEKTDNNMIRENFRGYWISHNIETEGGVAQPVAYTYRTLDGNDLVWKVGVVLSTRVDEFFDPALPFATPDVEAEVMRVYGKDTKVENFGRFSVSMFLLKQGRFIVVSTGSKVLDPAVGEGGGVCVYRLDHNNGNPRLELVDRWDKVCHNTSNKNVKLDEPYIYASCGGLGVFKLKLDYYEDGKDNNGNPRRKVQLVPVAKRVSTVMTESETPANTNYVQCNLNMDKIHVAGGYEGYYTLDLEDSAFIPADPRTDLVDHK